MEEHNEGASLRILGMGNRTDKQQERYDKRQEKKATKAKLKKQKQARKHKNRVDRKMFGRGKKRQALAKAEFQAENKAMAQADAMGSQDLSNNPALQGGESGYDFGEGSTQVNPFDTGSAMHHDYGSAMHKRNGHSMSTYQGPDMSYLKAHEKDGASMKRPSVCKHSRKF